MTRDDHPNVSDQLYANYAIGQESYRSGASLKTWVWNIFLGVKEPPKTIEKMETSTPSVTSPRGSMYGIFTYIDPKVI